MSVHLGRKFEIFSKNSGGKIRVSQMMDREVQNGQSVAVVLPTYCEAENIENLIRELQKSKLSLTITVIDDSSPDGTANIVRKLQEEYDNILLFVRPAKLGLGTAITDGFRIVLSLEDLPDYVVTMDADYSHSPGDIPRLIRAAKGGYGLVIGSRYCEGGRIVGWHFARWLISRIANLIASTIIGTRIHDCTSGLRCYSKHYIKTVLPNLHSQTYEIQIETVKQAWLRGFRVKEIPITFENRKRGKSKLTRAEFQGFLSYIIKCKIGGFGF
ncbi:MAG: polyprenol monophosphomannose synthase [Candidatus Hodarchaeota archaeon]